MYIFTSYTLLYHLERETPKNLLQAQGKNLTRDFHKYDNQQSPLKRYQQQLIYLHTMYNKFDFIYHWLYPKSSELHSEYKKNLQHFKQHSPAMFHHHLLHSHYPSIRLPLDTLMLSYGLLLQQKSHILYTCLHGASM